MTRNSLVRNWIIDKQYAHTRQEEKLVDPNEAPQEKAGVKVNLNVNFEKSQAEGGVLQAEKEEVSDLLWHLNAGRA